MDKAKILRLCNEIENIAIEIQERTMKDSYFMAQQIINKVLVIGAEISAQPKTNAGRISQMTDEELADFFCKISQCCGNDECSLCPIFEGCAQNVMCVERWLKKEADEDAGTETD